MTRVSGISEIRSVDGGRGALALSGLLALMHSKYGDVILLGVVILAFGMLLAISATS